MSGKGRPGAVVLSGERYVCTLLKIVERDGKGRPRSLTVLYDEETTTLRGGEHFLAVYIHEPSLQPKRDPESEYRAKADAAALTKSRRPS